MSGLFLAFAVMTALAVAAVLWPAFRDQRLARRESFELGVYRDQLAEIERDLERGLIAPAEARAARTEIERRLLRVANAAEGRGSEAPAPARRAVLLAAAVLLPLLAAGLYYRLGAPNLPDQPLAARQDRQPAPGQPDIAAMVARLEARLREAPEDVEGWLMLGRSKAVLGDAPASVAAYRRAQALAGDDPQVLAGLGEALTVAAGGTVTPEAKGLFARLAERQPGEPRAAFYLGWAEAQAGDYHAALERWRKLLAVTPADAPWRERVIEAIRTAAGELDLDPDQVLAAIPTPAAPPQPSPSQPSPEDAARIAAMPPEQRMVMIRSMVDKLAARLEANGGDVEGWQRLAQAREVLGESEQARATYEKALMLHPNDPGLLKGYAASLLGPVRGETGFPEINDRAAELFEKAASLSPDDPEPWWYLGIRALQDGRKDEAKAHWQKVLAHLDPSHPDYAMIRSRLDQLGG